MEIMVFVDSEVNATKGYGYWRVLQEGKTFL